MGQTEERRVASLRNREVIWDISKISRLESKFKKKDTTQVVSFFLGFAGRRPAPPFGDFNCSGEMNSPCAKVLGQRPKTLVRRTRAARPEGRLGAFPEPFAGCKNIQIETRSHNPVRIVRS